MLFLSLHSGISKGRLTTKTQRHEEESCGNNIFVPWCLCGEQFLFYLSDHFCELSSNH
jgi:hypothetical protein